VAEVGGQRQHHLVDVDALAVPQHYATHREGVPQIVDTRPVVSAAVDPTQLVTQLDENAMYLTLAQRVTKPPSPGTDEERRLGSRRYRPTT
jgi:hypothetical protein